MRCSNHNLELLKNTHAVNRPQCKHMSAPSSKNSTVRRRRGPIAMFFRVRLLDWKRFAAIARGARPMAALENWSRSCKIRNARPLHATIIAAVSLNLPCCRPFPTHLLGKMDTISEGLALTRYNAGNQFVLLIGRHGQRFVQLEILDIPH